MSYKSKKEKAERRAARAATRSDSPHPASPDEQATGRAPEGAPGPDFVPEDLEWAHEARRIAIESIEAGRVALVQATNEFAEAMARFHGILNVLDVVVMRARKLASEVGPPAGPE